MNRMVIKRLKNIVKTNEELAFRLKVLTFKISEQLSQYIDDDIYIKKQYKRKTGKDFDLNNPKLYNEKIQWMKLNYKNSLLNKCVDKYQVRDYVKSKIDNADSILIPLIGVYNSINEIDFKQLPDRFILKLTNGSSFNFICLKKSPSEIKKIKKRFAKWIGLDYYTIGREWAYKDVENRIICEELLLTSTGTPPNDYKFFCFNGKVKIIAVNLESVINGAKASNYYRNLYDENWNRIDGTIGYPNKHDFEIPKPVRLKDMINVAEKLSEDFPAVRVDFYYFDGKFYFGELTFYHASGYQNIQPYTLEKQMGDWITIV